MSTNEIPNATTQEMAEVLDLSPRRLQQLASEGWIVGRASHGRWNVAETVQSYLKHVMLQAAMQRR